MLYVYGSLMPLRPLEEIRFWKMQEKEHTVVIRELVPALEPPYAALLRQWEGVFARTEAAAQQWIEAVIRSSVPPNPYVLEHIDRLLQVSTLQSREWIRRLFLMNEQSAPVRSNPVVQTVVMHIIRESEYFLGVLQAARANPAGVPVADPLAAVETAGAPLPGAFPEPYTGTADWRQSAAETEPEEPPQPAPEAKEVFLHVVREEPSGTAESPGTPLEDNLTATQEGTWSEGIRPGPPQDRPVSIGGHKLPPLPYAYNALEPHIDAETMRLHHDKHHKTYVDGLNHAEKMLARARETGDFALVAHWEREAAFHGAGHYLHTIFWNIMKPGGGEKRPERSLRS
ncbi:DUF2935 domain-containing protein [Paenibacillus sp. P26]|nr:DUF2935 domain-containing protein [Paenibacillus sp. P26]